MAFKLPWSNFHELNLDWILEKIKELREDVDNITGSATPYTSIPEMDGVGSPGTEVAYSRGDHRHPTDTSRASAADLAQEILDRDGADNTLQANIDATDAKIKFSSSAPYMDSSSASAGFSDYMARADHVHPTDTSRASATDLATLTARVDAFSGSAAPSDATPLMDGVGAAGSGGNYSRGDHVHPSDTSKLDKAGGTITGVLHVKGTLFADRNIAEWQTSAPGWYRVATIPRVQGTCVKIGVVRKSISISPEMHKATLYMTSNPQIIEDDSISDTKIVDKIRYTSAGALDIHVDQNYPSDMMVYLYPEAPTATDMDAIHTIPVESVNEAPAGETVLDTLILSENGVITGTLTPQGAVTLNEVHAEQYKHLCEVNFYATGTFTANTATLIATLSGMAKPVSNVRMTAGCGASASTANASCYLVMDTDGNISINPSANCSAVVVNITYAI